ncbi:response regulator [Paraburkholderia phytofirmans]|uniref:histidine kinase n=1 Tax=Paraburkholderia phytofirmans (strain DSM 17436 / LMG 22146 / PsJN) TaxID=398527 RepID=B2TA90_PARPJ|nr:response regulator [Paraburkholderia phytofirmans]ACD21392.1 multi-sensor hybrid histidine kinase [Paraburkholderia phytofirmans PsJN]
MTRRVEEIALKQPDRFMSDAPLVGSAAPSFLAGGGELGALIRAYDWTQTALGAPDTWPQGLKIAIRIMLTSRQPLWIGWGDELLYFYNDPYKSIIGGKHPVALGQPTRVVWREIWTDIEPLLDTALAGAEGIFVEQKLLIMERNGFPEETYYTFSYSPIPGEDGEPGGIICANSDNTAQVVGERQLALLKELAAVSPNGRDWREACELSARALQANPQDLPFALLYAAEPGSDTVTLVGACGIEPGHPAAPQTMRVGESLWPIADVVKIQAPQMVRDLTQRFGTALPRGPWHLAPEQAVILPVSAGSESTQTVLLIAGLNPCRLVDDAYRSFLNLVAGQIGAAIGYAQAYEEERRRAEALAEIDRAKTTFFSNISHEFRTPLTLMLGPLEELLARPQPGPSGNNAQTRSDIDDRALIEITHRNGLRLLKLVNALLDFSRIEAGRIEIHTQPTDIAAFTAELASLFQSAMEAAGLRLEVEIPATPVVVQLDREMWEKVVMNLLSNAYKFTFFGTVRVAVRAVTGGVEVSVTDSGIGVAEEEVPRLFERFHRVAGAPGRSVEGSGIGLAMVQELVKLHGGTVRVDSVLGEGACFTVSLPSGAVQSEREDAGVHATMSKHARSYVDAALRWSPENEIVDGASIETASADETSPEAAPAAAARLLVVDDNADLREYMSRILRAAGHDVRLASDGQAALEAARAEAPDLVLSDVMMPRLDGFGLLRALRADPHLRDTPVLMLSARAGEEARVDGIEHGADDYLTKPFSARELLARVSGNLQLARLRRETEMKLREESRTLEILNRVGSTVAAELDLNRAVQIVTDAATELTGAAFGSFFYNVLDQKGGSYMLFTLSGVQKEAFERLPMPRNTAVFAPTFQGDGIVRVDDITQDPRYGHNAPHRGMPDGHVKVRSYLAAPVQSRGGEVVGGLFFGHPEPGVFTERAERIVAGIAAQAAIAIDNARLYQAAQIEIAERTKAQSALRDLNETLERRVIETVADRDRLWELSEDLLVVADIEGRLQRVSPSWSTALGHNVHWLMSRSYVDLVHPDDVETVRTHLAELRRTGVPVRYENRFKRIDGTWRWVAWTLALDPDTTRIHGVGRDVTADKETTEALRHAEEALRMAQKMEAIGKLTGGVAHDFNNLLQVIGGNLQLLAKDVAGSEKPEQRVRNALAGVARGANLASQLLAFGRRQPLAPKVVNLGRFVRGLDDMLRRALGDGVEIETIVSGGLWNTLVDPFQVENALLNLAINARDAMSGHGKLTIEAGNAALDDAYAKRNAEVTPGQYVMLAVTDTGAGMSPEVRERVFEPFFTTKAEGQGTGLGLSMVYGFVKQSGGHVKIYSEEGHGTTIRIYLPRVRQEEDLETNIEAGPAKGGTETILAVEDDEEVRTTVVEMLSDLGYRVLKAKDAQSALAIVESGVPIDMLFTDVVMPGPLRSTELARKARERLPAIAVLFTSGYTDNAIVHSGRLDEGIELLSKPYTHEALARKVRYVLQAQNPQAAEIAEAEQHLLEIDPPVTPDGADSFVTQTRLRILLVEDDELIRVSTAELLRTFDFDILEAEGEHDAKQILSEHAISVMLTDVGLAGKSGVDLALDVCRERPDLRVIFLTGYDLVLTPAQRAVLPHAMLMRKPYDPLDLIDALKTPLR